LPECTCTDRTTWYKLVLMAASPQSQDTENPSVHKNPAMAITSCIESVNGVLGLQSTVAKLA